MNTLPAHAGALIQRVGGTGGAAGLHDDLRTLAEIHHAVGALAQEQAAVHGTAVLTALAGIDHRLVGGGDSLLQHQLAGGVGDHLHALAADEHIASRQRVGLHRTAGEGHLSTVVHRAADRQGAGILRQIAAAVDLGFGGLHEAHTVQENSSVAAAYWCAAIHASS